MLAGNRFTLEAIPLHYRRFEIDRVVPGPTTSGAFQTSYGGGSTDAWVAKFDSGGDALEYASYLGGSGNEGVVTLTYEPSGGIAIDSAGDAFLTGQTTSTNCKKRLLRIW